jgi:hypothetical protein
VINFDIIAQEELLMTEKFPIKPIKAKGMAKDSAAHLHTRAGALNPFLQQNRPSTIPVQSQSQTPPAKKTK